jgi:hypothetical protein
MCDLREWFVGILSDGRWGDIPSWVEALATVGAFVAATIAVRHSWSLLKIERANQHARTTEDDRRQLEAERSEQADLVAAWPSRGNARNITIENGSSLPIYDVALAFVNRAGDQRGLDIQDVLPPGKHTTYFPSENIKQDPVTGEVLYDENEQPENYRVLIRFRDAGGRIWQRDQFGVLRLVGRMTYLIPEEEGMLSVSEIVANYQQRHSPQADDSSPSKSR